MPIVIYLLDRLSFDRNLLSDSSVVLIVLSGIRILLPGNADVVKVHIVLLW